MLTFLFEIIGNSITKDIAEFCENRATRGDGISTVEVLSIAQSVNMLLPYNSRLSGNQ